MKRAMMGTNLPLPLRKKPPAAAPARHARRLAMPARRWKWSADGKSDEVFSQNNQRFAEKQQI
jgi:hypothetical protein